MDELLSAYERKDKKSLIEALMAIVQTIQAKEHNASNSLEAT